jgi:hypothetical protein
LHRLLTSNRVSFIAGFGSDGIKNGDRSEGLPSCKQAFDLFYSLLIAGDAGTEPSLSVQQGHAAAI